MQTQSQSDTLNSRQKRFLEIYHQTGKAGESWTRAGYTASGKTARSAASRFLKRDDAQAYLNGLQHHDSHKTSLTREKLLNRLERIIDSPDARDRDVIQAIKEANRMLGTYNKPEPPPRKEPGNPLRNYIAAVRRGEIPDSDPEILNHLLGKSDPTPPPEPEDPQQPAQDNSYQPADAELHAIFHHTIPNPEVPLPTPITRAGDPWAAREARQNAQAATSKGRPGTPPSKTKPAAPKETSNPASGFYTRLNRHRRAQRRKQTATK